MPKQLEEAPGSLFFFALYFLTILNEIFILDTRFSECQEITTHNSHKTFSFVNFRNSCCDGKDKYSFAIFAYPQDGGDLQVSLTPTNPWIIKSGFFQFGLPYSISKYILSIWGRINNKLHFIVVNSNGANMQRYGNKMREIEHENVFISIRSWFLNSLNFTVDQSMYNSLIL